jgi:hypothetical protein
MEAPSDVPNDRLEPGPPSGRRLVAVRVLAALFGAGAFLLGSAFFPPSPRADIYRWVDGGGAVHFTDDASTIPPAYRKNATRMIREAPGEASPPAHAIPPGPNLPPPPPEAGIPSGEQAPPDVEASKEQLAAQAEQLRAKIAAKERHLRDVDAKRLPGANPLRNRIVDQEDMDLYEKYRAELPGDRERLDEIESRLDSFK